MGRDPIAPSDAAVIDVGSNSVRLVVYRLEGRAIWTVYNEKVLAGLGRELSETGRLSKDGVETAMVIYPGEGHAIRQPRHREDVLRRTLDWFRAHDTRESRPPNPSS